MDGSLPPPNLITLISLSYSLGSPEFVVKPVMGSDRICMLWIALKTLGCPGADVGGDRISLRVDKRCTE